MNIPSYISYGSHMYIHKDDYAAALAEKDAEIERLKKALDQAIEISGICLASDDESVADGTESTAFWHRKPELAAYLKEKGQ